MRLTNWLRFLKKSPARSRKTRARAHNRPLPQAAEVLEDRTLLFSAVGADDAFVVDTTVDEFDVSAQNPDPGENTSLREAIWLANQDANHTTITLEADGFYQLTIGGSDFPSFAPEAAGDLDVSSSVTITVADGGRATIDAGGENGLGDRVFQFSGFASTVNLENLTISGGRVFGQDGGGLYVLDASVNLIDVNVTGNVAFESEGGGRGGGIYNSVQSQQSLHLYDSVVSNNEAALGGGIFNDFNAHATLAGSAIVDNQSDGDGGGIYNSGDLESVNTTIAGNEALDGTGGGLFNSGDATLINNTIADNDDYGGIGGVAGIAQLGSVTRIGNSIIARNQNGDAGGAFESLGHNLIGNADGSSGFTSDDDYGGAGNRLSAGLSVLRDNGGPTPTISLLPGSPAINAGDDNLLVNQPPQISPPVAAALQSGDQRGFTRQVGASVDIGAVETQSMDFGDALATYGTTLADNGARHIVNQNAGPRFGSTIDAELDGSPGSLATGDDLADPDDEDGLVTATLVRGVTGSAVTVRTAGPDPGTMITGSKINAWIDFDANGIFETSEQIATDVEAGGDEGYGGDIDLPVDVPINAALGAAVLRIRISSKGGDEFNGIAPDGEVEDHVVNILARPVADAGGPYTIPEGTSVTLDASGSTDSDNPNTLTYQWDLDYDGETFDVDVTGVAPQIFFPETSTPDPSPSAPPTQTACKTSPQLPSPSRTLHPPSPTSRSTRRRLRRAGPSP